MIEKADLENNLQRIHEWTRSADEKVSIFLAFQGIVLTLLFERVFSWTKNNFTLLCNGYYVIAVIIALVLIAFSIHKSTSAIRPRLNGGKKKSIIYFGHISSLDSESFKKEVKNTNQNDYEDQLIDQIYISSKIASRKHTQFRDALICFLGGLAVLVIVFIIFSLQNYGK
jgi:hypothetical protein